MEPVETAVAVTFGVLAAFFLASLATLFLFCYKRISTKHAKLYEVNEYNSESGLVASNTNYEAQQWSEFELDDVKLAPQIRKILNDTQWVDDASGLIPHSLGILKLCHQLTEKLLVPALAERRRKCRLYDIIQISRRVSPRIDDVASAMYPPLDPRLLEARCSALVMALHLLVWHARATTPDAIHGFIQEVFSEMENHLAVSPQRSSHVS
ncbi:Transmembrane protein 98 [Armadillidium nasatum]|uniref:Transmembrane protein 98 n=1 Tax=Armadillidium nasatum TaxID=96803 RepID=A0A5N5SXH9_9CRUS|nr:Transmembrane protein 98 [Armadillidium nasatum]